MEAIAQELRGIAGQLREAAVKSSVPAPEPARPEPDREEMAQALAAAVARLRARVAVPVEPDEQESGEQEPEGGEPEPEEPESGQVLEPKDRAPEPEPTPPEPKSMPTPFIPRVLAHTDQREPWLAPAIRRVAEERDAKLAGELVCELLPAQRVKRALTYTLRIEGLGDVQVRLEGERAAVRRPSAGTIVAPGAGGSGQAAGGQAAGVQASGERGSHSERGAFLLEGPASAFAELAAGGTGRRLPGVKVHGSRRKLRRLLAARRAPLALSDLADAGIQVWPGLLLLALAQAIDSQWTKGHSFVLAFAIEGQPSATLYVQVRNGEPIEVTRVRGEQPLSTVRLSERAFVCVLSGAPLPSSEQVLVEGPLEPLTLLLGWSDRAQGLVR
jgi:hypothetical protein